MAGSFKLDTFVAGGAALARPLPSVSVAVQPTRWWSYPVERPHEVTSLRLSFGETEKTMKNYKSITLMLAFVLVFAVATAILGIAQEPKIHQPKLTPQNSGTTQLLISVSPVNSKVVWAAGTGGTYVVTTDGGNTWKAAVVPGAEKMQFRDVQGVSDKVAYLMSIGNNTTDFRIYKTVDGGATWTIEFTNKTANAFYDCFAFWTPKRGITHSDSVNGVFPAIRTTDGVTWQSISSNMPPALPGEAS